MIEIHGDYLEGGGQILRSSIGLSALTGQPFRITGIRKGRKNPGLAAQHLTAIKAVAEICTAKVNGAELGSTAVQFEPGKAKPGSYSFDIGTAGSASLVLQALFIPSLGRSFEFRIKGGTDNPWAPTTTYMRTVFIPILQRMGARLEIETLKHGFYPKGGGLVHAKTSKAGWKPLNLTERGNAVKTDALSFVSYALQKARVSERQVASAEKILGEFSVKSNSYVETASPGSSLTLHTHFSGTVLGASALGERGKSAEQVGEEAAQLLGKQLESKACLDRWMADQIVPYMAIAAAKGENERQNGVQSFSSAVSVSEITKHALTNIWVTEKFLPVRFSVKGKQGESGIISVRSD